MKRHVIPLIAVSFLATACGMFRGSQKNEGLIAFTINDLTVAKAYAEAHPNVEGMKALANCTAALLSHSGEWTTAEGEAPVVGVFTAYAKAKVTVAQFRSGIPEDVHIACAPVVLDAHSVLRRLALLGVGLGR